MSPQHFESINARVRVLYERATQMRTLARQMPPCEFLRFFPGWPRYCRYRRYYGNISRPRATLRATSCHQLPSPTISCHHLLPPATACHWLSLSHNT